MGLFWIAVVALAIFVEKVLPRGRGSRRFWRSTWSPSTEMGG